MWHTVARVGTQRGVARPREGVAPVAARRPAPASGLGNRGLTALLQVQREEGWAGQTRGSKNRGGPIAITAPGGTTVRRHAIRGLKSKQMLTDMLIAVIPDGLPRDGSAVDVLVHLHGHEVWGEDKDKNAASRFRNRVRGRPRPRRRAAHRPRRDAARGADVGGRPTADRPAAARVRQVGLQPGRRLGLRPRQLREGRVRAADGRQGVGRRRRPGGPPPTPGRVTLSGHSGADQPITQMLSGGKAGDLAGLFLFDTMYVNDAEKKREAEGTDARELAAQARGQGRGLRQGPLRRRPRCSPGCAGGRPAGVGRATRLPAQRGPRPGQPPLHRVVGAAADGGRRSGSRRSIRLSSAPMRSPRSSATTSSRPPPRARATCR